MELRHIRYFKAVAEEKSFTRAAEKLNIAQPPLSRQIQDLEQELDTKLFMRSPHKITLTKEGELFLQYANQILDLVSRSSEEVSEGRAARHTLYRFRGGLRSPALCPVDLLFPEEASSCAVQSVERQYR